MKTVLKGLNNDPKLDGTMSVDDLGYSDYDWSVSEFLRPIFVDGISYVTILPVGSWDALFRMLASLS